MGCGFCATGQGGFDRHSRWARSSSRWRAPPAGRPGRGRRLSRVVFMGMGEPLANYDATWGAIERIHDDLGLSARHLTLSTVGIVPGIRRLAGEALPVNLAVSLHAADDELRDKLVPINRRYPLAAVAEACREYLAAKGRRLSFEWALIDGVNDALTATRLAGRARPPLGRPRQPHPAQPDAMDMRAGHAGGRGAPPSRLAGRAGVNATVRANRGMRHRRRLWPAGGPVAARGR